MEWKTNLGFLVESIHAIRNLKPTNAPSELRENQVHEAIHNSTGPRLTALMQLSLRG